MIDPHPTRHFRIAAGVGLALLIGLFDGILLLALLGALQFDGPGVLGYAIFASYAFQAAFGAAVAGVLVLSRYQRAVYSIRDQQWRFVLMVIFTAHLFGIVVYSVIGMAMRLI